MNLKTNRLVHVIHHSAIIITGAFMIMYFILKLKPYDAIPYSVVVGVGAFVWMVLFGRTHGYLK